MNIILLYEEYELLPRTHCNFLRMLIVLQCAGKGCVHTSGHTSQFSNYNGGHRRPASLASNKEKPRAAEANHSLQTAPLSPPGPTDTVSPAAPSQEQNEESTAHHEAGDEEGEMELMDQDEMEFLEGNAQLGSLKSGKITS